MRCPRALLIALAFAACGEEQKPPAPETLSVLTTALPAGRLGMAYDQKVQAKGGTPPYSFAVTGALPSGLEIKAATGQISGVAAVPGPYSFKVVVNDAGGQTASVDLSIYVEPDPLRIETTTLPSGYEGTPYDEPLAARGGVPPLVWSLASGALPTGLTLSAEGRLSGTPADFGGYDFVVQVNDAETRSATVALHLFLTSQTPMITTATLILGRYTDPYELRFEAEGGRPPYTWELSAGALPAGMGIDSEGVLAGTPTDSGRFTFTVRVLDSAGERDEKDFTLTVLAPLLITTRALPSLILNRPAELRLEASGGLPPYNWILSMGTLPAGLTFDPAGFIRGTVTEAGDFPIRVAVQDAFAGSPRSANLTIRVSDFYVYEVEPMLAFPPVCTSTRVSYQTVEIEVTESYEIQDLTIDVNIDYSNAAPGNTSNGELAIWMFAPDGRRTVLCGGAAGHRGENGCDINGGNLTTSYPAPSQPEIPLRVFQGMNPRGTWRFQAVVTRPSMQGGSCQQRGQINLIRLNVRDNRSPNPYVLVTGFTRNNLVIDPWIRIGRTNPVPGGGTTGEDEIFLTATLWNLGPNGVREAGQGDDVPDPRPFTWSSGPLPRGATITPDGHASGARCGGNCVGGEGTITASDGMGNVVNMTLLVIPPDWNRANRQF